MRVIAVLACVLLSVAGCATMEGGRTSATEQTEWLKVGLTTRDEVIKRFGDPDGTAQLPQGELVVYRPPRPATPSPAASVPTFEAGPLGTVRTVPINRTRFLWTLNELTIR